MILTPRDLDILTALTWKGRLLGDEQLAAAWWPPGRSGRVEATRRADRLVAAGLLRKVVVLCRPLPALERPVVVADGPGTRPDFGRAAHILRRRWSRPTRPIGAYLATAKAAALTGGRAPGLKHPLQASHDLACMQVYLLMKATHPDLADAWVGEDCVPWPRGLRVRRADAVIRDPAGAIALAVEIGGSGSAYGRERLEAMHEHFSSRGLPYLLW